MYFFPFSTLLGVIIGRIGFLRQRGGYVGNIFWSVTKANYEELKGVRKPEKSLSACSFCRGVALKCPNCTRDVLTPLAGRQEKLVRKEVEGNVLKKKLEQE
jgi:hypothetical protein